MFFVKVPNDHDIELVLKSVEKLLEVDANIKSNDYKSSLFHMYDFFNEFYSLKLERLRPVFDKMRVVLSDYVRRDSFVQRSWNNFKDEKNIPNLLLDDYIFGYFLVNENYEYVWNRYANQDEIKAGYSCICTLSILLLELDCSSIQNDWSFLLFLYCLQIRSCYNFYI